jgi:hypothetical protein
VAWAPCASPRSFKLTGRDDGDYFFEARTTDAAGNVSATLRDGYVFDTTPPREPEIAGTPGATGSDRSPAWSFTSELDASFECQLKRGATSVEDWASCTSPKRYVLPSGDAGEYGFAVRATDAAGNTGKIATSSYRLVPATSPAAGGSGGGAPSPGAPSDPSAPAAGGDKQPRRAAGSDPEGAPSAESNEGGAAARARTGGRGREAASPAPRPGSPGSASRGQGSPDARASEPRDEGVVGKTLDTARRAVERAVTVAADNADKSIFPLSLVVIVAGFLLLQGRIDRNDPKLALAPALADTQMEFGPPARLGRLHSAAGPADRGEDVITREEPDER